MLRPVELNASRNPWAGEADQCRFDDMVVVDEMPLADLVVSHLDSASQCRQNHSPDVFVFDPYDIILLVMFLV